MSSRTTIKRFVNSYGFVTYEGKDLYVGNEFAGKAINLILNPSCLGHMCTEANCFSGIADRKSEQSVFIEASEEINIQDRALPTFCRNVLISKPESLEIHSNKLMFKQPVSLFVRRLTGILLRNEYFGLTATFFQSQKEILPRFVFINNLIHYFTQKFNSFFHKTTFTTLTNVFNKITNKGANNG